MKKKFDLPMFAMWICAVALIGALILFIVFLARDGNSRNSVGTSTNCIEWFTDTGVDVRNSQNRVYHVYADPNGYLYFGNDLEGALCPVLDEFGEPAKDPELFTYSVG